MIEVETKKIRTWDFVSGVMDAPPEFKDMYENGFHINLERCDLKNDWEWFEMIMLDKKYTQVFSKFCAWHYCMTKNVFPWTNWKKYMEM